MAKHNFILLFWTGNNNVPVFVQNGDARKNIEPPVAAKVNPTATEHKPKSKSPLANDLTKATQVKKKINSEHNDMLNTRQVTHVTFLNRSKWIYRWGKREHQ